MNSVIRRIGMIGAVMALAMTGAAHSVAESFEPPLLPGEAYITTPKGCGYIVPKASLDAWGGAEKFFAGMKSIEWQEPPCVNGLLHGEAYSGSGDTHYWAEYAYGRPLYGTRTTKNKEVKDVQYVSDCAATCAKSVSLTRLGPDYAPYWDPEDRINEGSSLTVSEYKTYVLVGTDKQSCKDSITPVKKCSDKNDFEAFGIWEYSWQALDGGNSNTIYNRFTACPDPLTTVGCEVLWRQLAGPSIILSDAIIAQAKVDREANLAKYAALTEPWIARRGDLYRAHAAATAEQQTAQIRASLAAADERARAADAAQAGFRKTLATGNAGQLFAMADELASSGDIAKARDAFRSLVSRFPDHPLAATAATRLGGLGGAPTSSPAKVSARYSSVCVRNLEKVENALRAANNQNVASTYDAWLIQVNDLTARLFQPCIAYDKEAAENYQRAVSEAAKIRQYCAGAHASHECLPWGYSSAAMNQRWYSVWEAEMKRSFADPNYSADLGTAKGPNGTVVGAGVQTASAAGASDPEAHERCRAELHRLGKEFEGHRARIPADQTVPLMELILWYNDTAWLAIDKNCPTVEAYKPEQASYMKTYRATAKACDQIATKRCGPRLPD